MPKKTIYRTPGVYIEEVKAFPNSVVQVPTAVPAFIGYSPKAEYEGVSYRNKPTKVNSFAKFRAIFCLPDPPLPADPAKQYSPNYYLVDCQNPPTNGRDMTIEGKRYSIQPDPCTVYYLYNSVKMFYENGGGTAYVVSIGEYGKPSGKPNTPGNQIVNSNVRLSELLNGLALLKNEQEPTMYVFPEATLLSPPENGTLIESALLQNKKMRTAVSILDIIGGKEPDPVTFTNDIQDFRNRAGTVGLDFGAAYYPFVGATVMQSGDLDYTNLFGGDTQKLEPLLNPRSNPNAAAKNILSEIENPPAKPPPVSQYNKELILASKTYAQIMKLMLADANLLPPSGAMAGVYASTDNNRGVWKAPANVSIVGVSELPIHVSNTQQENLNVDPVSGKSVNAIRFFAGKGILVWGARTLDGNSSEWRYISVRRTLIMLEQSIKKAAQSFVFEPNDSSTWNSVTAMVENFLTQIWRTGGLQGTKPEHAFYVQCGLGITMTAQDILDGIMKLNVGVAVSRPAEFIVFSVTQKMAK